jgi:hypothetical protein
MTVPFFACMSVTSPTDDHPKIYFQPKPKKKRGEKQVQWSTSSWNVGKKHLADVLGEIYSDGDVGDVESEDKEAEGEQEEDQELPQGGELPLQEGEKEEDCMVEEREVEVHGVVEKGSSSSGRKRFSVFQEIEQGVLLSPWKIKKPKKLE